MGAAPAEAGSGCYPRGRGVAIQRRHTASSACADNRPQPSGPLGRLEVILHSRRRAVLTSREAKAFPGGFVRIGYTAAAVAAALAFTLFASTLAGGARAPARSTHRATAKQHAASSPQLPRRTFPLLGRPQYGDGLDAGRGHEGQDLLIAAGTPIVAVANSVVLGTGNSGGRGN